jgi:hypothetical protein
MKERMLLPLKWVSVEGIGYTNFVTMTSKPNNGPIGMDERIFSEGSDCWSFGVMCWEILAFVTTFFLHIFPTTIFICV